MLSNCGAGEDSWESLDIKIKPVRPKGKSTLNIHWKDCCWSWSSNTLAIWCKELTHWKRPWSWERLRAGGEGDDRGWDGWMASLTRWTWVWASSGRWWRTGKLACCSPWGLRESDMTEQLNWTDWILKEYGLVLFWFLLHQFHRDFTELKKVTQCN